MGKEYVLLFPSGSMKILLVLFDLIEQLNLIETVIYYVADEYKGYIQEQSIKILKNEEDVFCLIFVQFETLKYWNWIHIA